LRNHTPRKIFQDIVFKFLCKQRRKIFSIESTLVGVYGTRPWDHGHQLETCLMNRRLKIEAGFLRIQLTTSKFPAKAQKHARPILDHLFVDTTASELSCQHAVGGFGQHHGEYIYLWTERISTLKYPYLWFNYQPFERHCGKFELAGVSSK